ncbi:MAG: DUF4367 domain-containing protein [Clostridia bacterium]|nr:DUF4367 domain-containing protein [Clostridia bacterium]
MMENNKQIIADAYGKAMDAEYDAILAEDETEPHQFSERFEEKMNDLINGDASEKKGASRRRLRPIWLIAAAVLLLAATACAVPSIRKSIAGFFVKMFGDHVEYTDPDITKDRIEEEYELVPIPEGFELNTESGSKTRTLRYEDDKGRYIILIQTVDTEIQLSVDNEEGEFSEQTIANKSCRMYISDDGSQASWIENGYFFSMTCSAGVDITNMIECVRTIDE